MVVMGGLFFKNFCDIKILVIFFKNYQNKSNL